MRGRVRIGLVAFSVAGVSAVVGKVGVSAALDNPAPAVATFDSPSAEVAPSDFGPSPNDAERMLVAKVETAAFGTPPADLLAASRDNARALVARRNKDRLAALAAEAAALATDAELDALIAQLETTVAEKRAAAELRQARESLERLVAAFPQTEAADAAREMLDREPSTEAAATLIPVEAPR